MTILALRTNFLWKKESQRLSATVLAYPQMLATFLRVKTSSEANGASGNIKTSAWIFMQM
jgi:hypothetical protein